MVFSGNLVAQRKTKADGVEESGRSVFLRASGGIVAFLVSVLPFFFLSLFAHQSSTAEKINLYA